MAMIHTTDPVTSTPVFSEDNSETIYFLYEAYYFEQIIYLYVWEILVIVTCLLNVIVISVLLRKSMRTPLYIILAAIAMSDSLTGLVTLPSYIAVFQQFSPTTVFEANSTEFPDWSSINTSSLPPDLIDQLKQYNETRNSNKATQARRQSYILSETLCDGFMLSKFFLSKTFHTVSVWLTLFLALQRFRIIYSPLKINHLRMKNVLFVCLLAFLLAPFLHIYHVFKDKSVQGHCRWTISTGNDCGSDCVYFWFSLVLGQLLPCVLLAVFTVYFTYGIRKNASSLRLVGNDAGTDSTFSQRHRENRRLSVIVTAIMIVFLIPELPYTGYLLYVLISAHADSPQNLEFNRSIYAIYEVFMVLSFNANFYIYTFFNKTFRKLLKGTICSPIYRIACRGTIQLISTVSSRYVVGRSNVSSEKLSDTNVMRNNREETHF